MANFAVEQLIVGPEDLDVVMTDSETYLETVDDSKTIYLMQLVKDGDDRFRMAIIHDT